MGLCDVRTDSFLNKSRVCEQGWEVFAAVLKWNLSAFKFLNGTGKIVLTDLCSRD